MLLSILMLFTWQVTNDVKYEEPFKKCVEAAYSTSSLKQYAESTNEVLRKKAPMLYHIAIPSYGIIIRRQIHFTTNKITIVPGNATTYHYDERTKTGSVGIVFGF